MPGDVYLSLQRGSIPTSPSTITQDHPTLIYLVCKPGEPPFHLSSHLGLLPQQDQAAGLSTDPSIIAVALPGSATSSAKHAAGLHAAAGRGQDLHHCLRGACTGKVRGAVAHPPPLLLAAGADPVQHQTPLPHAASLLPPKLRVVPAGWLVPLQVPCVPRRSFIRALSQQGLFQLDSHVPARSLDGNVRRGES